MNNISRAKIKDGLNARRAAFAVLNNVLVKKKSLSEAFVMESELIDDLSSRDRSFTKLLVNTVLKHTVETDLILQRFLYEPIGDLRPNTLINVFRLGLAQFLFLDTASYAVINNSLDLVEEAELSHQKNLVNTVIRRITSEGVPAIDIEDSVKVNTPEWLWNEWLGDYGEDITKQIALANFDESVIDISVKKDAEKWVKTLSGDLLPTGSIRKNENAAVYAFEGSFDKECWVQNAASAIPVKLLGDVRGKTVIDLCAAPGTKTAQLASSGANVIAVERSATRLKHLQNNMEILKFDEVQTVVADGTVWKPEAQADILLLDAPSTETGLIRQQPDILRFLDKVDLDKAVTLQRALIENAAKMVKEGGTLLYCVSSLQKEEGERIFDWVLDQNLPLRPYPIRVDEIGGIDEMVTMRGELRSLPYHWDEFGGIDGIYIARFVKV